MLSLIKKNGITTLNKVIQNVPQKQGNLLAHHVTIRNIPQIRHSKMEEFVYGDKRPKFLVKMFDIT